MANAACCSGNHYSTVHWSQSLVETLPATGRLAQDFQFLKHLSFLFGQKPDVGSWKTIASDFGLPTKTDI